MCPFFLHSRVAKTIGESLGPRLELIMKSGQEVENETDYGVGWNIGTCCGMQDPECEGDAVSYI